MSLQGQRDALGEVGGSRRVALPQSRGGASRTFSGHISDDGITDAFVVTHERCRLPLRMLRRDAARNVETAIVLQGGVARAQTWCVCHVMRARVARKDTMPYNHGGIMQITEADRPTGASTLASDATTRRPVLPGPVSQGADGDGSAAALETQRSVSSIGDSDYLLLSDCFSLFFLERFVR